MINEETFLKDVSRHAMVVLQDDGVRRHLRFRNPLTGNMSFDLITWPGHLCYTGDMGCYVFQRQKDMFDFFRSDSEKYGQSLRINPDYWAEKVQGQDRHAGITKFSEGRFKEAVLGRLVDWLREHREDTTKEDRRELWSDVMREVIGADGDSGGYRKQLAAHDYNFKVNDQVRDFSFHDFGECNVEEYAAHFLWCCYAITWGIGQYEAVREQAQARPEQAVESLQRERAR